VGPLDLIDLPDQLVYVGGDADRPRTVGDRAEDRLADPPRRIGRELVPARVVELLDRFHQSEVPLLDQVEEREPATPVLLGDRDDEAEVRLGEFLLGLLVPGLDPFREPDLILAGEERDTADLAEVGTDRVVRPRRPR